MHSQNSEESIIGGYFDGFKGTFLDLGSYTGIELSNVRALAEKGWLGVMVEASPTVFEKLVNNYIGFPVDCYNVAVGTETKKVKFYDNHDAVGTMHKSETERWGNTQSFEEIEVQCVEINEFINVWTGRSVFDMISIDVEGEDLAIAKRIDFLGLKTKLICIEWNSKDMDKYNEIFIPLGYKLIHTNGENLIYTI